MNLEKMKSALQDLIIRLKDAERGYMEVKHAISDPTLSKWMQEYSQERFKFRQELEQCMKRLGGDATVKTSFLGDLHRIFIDIKLNNFEADYEAIVNEIERGASVLINDYDKVLKDLIFPIEVEDILVRQRDFIKMELDNLVELREQIKTVTA